jgi:hypothetical protein
MIFDSNENIVRSWARRVEGRLVDEYQKAGRKASGEWANELETEQKVTLTKINVTFKAPFYTQWMENGRGKNKDQSDEGIRGFVAWAGSTFLAEWVKRKGIAANSFAVAYSIARNGYPGRPFVAKAINDEAVNQLIDDIGEGVKVNLINEVKKQFTNGGN